jgi:putative ABC transport system permease protein
MTGLRVLWSRLTDLVLRRRREDRLADEIQAHLDLLTDEHVARGMSLADARLAARKSFGGVDQAKERYRDRRGLPLVESMSQDVRNAWRSLRRTPTFTIVSILTLTLAIGANAGIGSLLNALLVRELPVRAPSTLVQVETVSPRGDAIPLTYTMFQELSRRQQVFSSVMGWWGASVKDVEVDGAIATAAVFAATGNLFDELGIRPLHGRLLVTSDMSLMPPAAETVAVVGYRFWKRYLHEDPAVVGRTIRIAGVVWTIVGVAPEGYTGLRLTIEPDVTIPLAAVPLLSGRTVESFAVRSTQWIGMVGRLKPDVSLSQARAQIDASWPALRDASLPADATSSQRDQHMALRVDVSSMARGFEPGLRARFTQPLLIVFGIAALVLCIACVNLASLALARAVASSHEIATRLALGGTRWRICRQLLVEGVVLSIAGGAGGVVAAGWASRMVSGVILADLNVPTAFDPTPDGRVMAVTFATTIIVGAIFSLAPCWWIVRQRASHTLRVDGRTVSGSGRFGTILVATQIALAVMLLVHAGLFIQTLRRVHSVDTGLEVNNVFVAYTRPFEGRYNDVDNDSYYPSLIERLRAVRGVEYASVSLLKPGGGGGIDTTVAPIGTPKATNAPEVTRSPVAPDFFRALGVTMREGRDFSFADNSRSQMVAVVSQSLAARLYPGRTALGERIRIGAQPRLQDVEVVGVAADSRVYDPKNDNLDAVYTPALQDPSEASYKCLVIRGRGVPMVEIERAVASLGREYVSSTESFNYIVGRTLLRERLTAALAGFFGFLAIGLSAIGIYGLMSYTVTQRRREAGIRLALGERPGEILVRVIRSALATAAMGTLAGLAVSLTTVDLARVLLFGIAPRDPATFVLAAAGMALVATAASILPALRLARVDPLTALREE